MFSDRRRAARERRGKFRVAAVFALKGTVGDRVFLGQAEDIGPSGMTVRRPKDAGLPQGTPVGVKFELPGTQGDVVARGYVINDEVAGIFRRTGIRFTMLPPEHRRRICDYCQQAAGGAQASVAA